jgi:hypothetical protein
VLPVVKFVPVRVTRMLALPRTPVLGAIEVSVGAGGAITVNVTALLVPPDVVTVTFLAVSAAVLAIVKVAVTVVGFTTVRLLTVTPLPDTFTADAPVRLVPVKVTPATVVPRTPVVGAIEVSVGAGTVPWNSTAPTSMLDLAMSGLLLPKKSVLGAAAYVGDVTGMTSIAGESAAGA